MRWEVRVTCSCNSRAAFLDSLDCGGGGTVLQDNPKLGELLVQLQKGGKKPLLC